MDRTSEQMRSLSFIDELSGMRNRRGFFLLAERRLDAARATRGGRLTVVLVSMEGLKDANDWHGRAAGTELIRDAARALTAAFGPDDVIARLGGGEFAVLSSSPPEGIRAGILRAVDERNKIVADRPFELELTVGAACLPVDDATTLDELIVAADADMHAHRGESPNGPPPVRTSEARPDGARKRKGSQAAA
jgi:diguanylate cyclase (GGDEF)-like protein